MQQMSNRAANWIMAKFSGVRIHDFGSGFKAYKRELLRNCQCTVKWNCSSQFSRCVRAAGSAKFPSSSRPGNMASQNTVSSKKFPSSSISSQPLSDGYLSRPMHFLAPREIGASFVGSMIAFGC